MLWHFLKESAREYNKKVPTYPPELVPLLMTYSFPGNVRELQSMVAEAVADHRSFKLSMDVFRQRIQRQRKRSIRNRQNKIEFPNPLPTMKSCVEALIAEAMKISRNNQKAAAVHLGITQQALNKRLNRKKKRKKSLTP